MLFLDKVGTKIDLKLYLGTSAHGSVLLTTRNIDYLGYAARDSIKVGNLEESEALTLLHTTATFIPSSKIDSLKIVRELGMLALAITQAGVFIRNERRFDTYLDILQKHHEQVLGKVPGDGSEYSTSTYTAFELSLKELPVVTLELLNLCYFLHHSAIPITLFERSIGFGFMTCTVRESSPSPKSDAKFISMLEQILGSMWDRFAFGNLVAPGTQASLLNLSSDGLFYSIHPSFKAISRTALVMWRMNTSAWRDNSCSAQSNQPKVAMRSVGSCSLTPTSYRRPCNRSMWFTRWRFTDSTSR